MVCIYEHSSLDFNRQAIDQSNDSSYLEVGSGLVILMAKAFYSCMKRHRRGKLQLTHGISSLNAYLYFTDISNSHDGNTSVLRPSVPLPKPYGSAHGSRE